MCENLCDNMGSFQTMLDGKSPVPTIQSCQIKWGERPQVCNVWSYRDLQAILG